MTRQINSNLFGFWIRASSSSVGLHSKDQPTLCARPPADPEPQSHPEHRRQQLKANGSYHFSHARWPGMESLCWPARDLQQRTEEIATATRIVQFAPLYGLIRHSGLSCFGITSPGFRSTCLARICQASFRRTGVTDGKCQTSATYALRTLLVAHPL